MEGNLSGLEGMRKTMNMSATIVDVQSEIHVEYLPTYLLNYRRT
jgi:hypothetical protein